MAILLRKKNQKVYVSSTGAVTDKEKIRADKLDSYLAASIKRLEKNWIEKGLLSKGGIKKDVLKIWYEMGDLLNKVVDKFKIRGTTDEPIFWQAIYGYVSKLVQRRPPPKRSTEWQRNHFRLCAKMAERPWQEVQRVGTWSMWRDIFDNSKLLEDERVFDWVVQTIVKSGLGHKDLRPFIHATRRRLKKIDTSILKDHELSAKLEEVEIRPSDFRPFKPGNG